MLLSHTTQLNLSHILCRTQSYVNSNQPRGHGIKIYQAECLNIVDFNELASTIQTTWYCFLLVEHLPKNNPGRPYMVSESIMSATTTVTNTFRSQGCGPWRHELRSNWAAYRMLFIKQSSHRRQQNFGRCVSNEMWVGFFRWTRQFTLLTAQVQSACCFQFNWPTGGIN